MSSKPSSIARVPGRFASDDRDLERIASELRHRVIRMSHAARTPHLGSALSCIDILVAAYWRVLEIDPRDPDSPNRDRLILSKGHAAMALYAVLAARGFFPADWLNDFARHGSPLAEQPAPFCAPGVELATGSLGHGLPVALGQALAGRIQGRDYRIVVVMSDGECNEGSVWEAAMFAPAQKLERVTVVIDYNRWQATGRSDEIMALPSLRAKWTAFGWTAMDVDGHDIDEISSALITGDREPGKPLAIIAHTVKGRGVSFMEDDNNWHYRIPTAEEVEIARNELGLP
jgi:transketolase